MGRHAKNTAEYFPHYANEDSSDTLKILDGRFANDGYAFWFRLLARLTRSENHYFDTNNKVKWEIFCKDCHITPEKGVEIIETLIELDAIDRELWQTHRIVWCDNLVSNLSEVYKNRKRPVPNKPVFTVDKLFSTVETDISTPNNSISTSQSRVEYSKVNDSNIVPSQNDGPAEKPKNKKPKEPTLSTNPNIAAMQSFLGFPKKTIKDPVPYPAKEAKFITDMMNRHYTWDEIFGAWKKKVTQRKKFVSMLYVGQDIGNGSYNHKSGSRAEDDGVTEVLDGNA